jgi:hypothetical protein
MSAMGQKRRLSISPRILARQVSAESRRAFNAFGKTSHSDRSL